MSHKVPRIKLNCLNCNKEIEVKQSRIDAGRGKYCSRACHANANLVPNGVRFEKGHKTWNKNKPHLAIRGENHYRWQGGYWIANDGYKMIEVKRLGKRYRIPEHRLIVETHLGRTLEEWEDVHHIDHNKLNNDINNLMVLSKSDHTKLHHEIRRGAM